MIFYPTSTVGPSEDKLCIEWLNSVFQWKMILTGQPVKSHPQLSIVDLLLCLRQCATVSSDDEMIVVVR